MPPGTTARARAKRAWVSRKRSGSMRPGSSTRRIYSHVLPCGDQPASFPRVMARPAPADRSPVRRVTAARYFDLVREGAIRSDDRVELLEGVIVAMSPQHPRHAAGVQWATEALFRAVGSRAVVRVQLPLVDGRHSVPEPDVAVVPGSRSDYVDAHPTTALLVVEVADVT